MCLKPRIYTEKCPLFPYYVAKINDYPCFVAITHITHKKVPFVHGQKALF